MTTSSEWDRIRNTIGSLDQAAEVYRKRMRIARESGAKADAETFDEWMSVTRGLLSQSRYDEAAVTLDALTEVFCESPDSAVAAKAVDAQVSAALLADQMGDVKAAIQRLRRILDEYDAEKADVAMRRSLCYAMRRLYELQTKADPDPEAGLRSALETIGRMAAEFGEDEDCEVAKPVAEALSNGVEFRLRLGDRQGAKRALKQIPARFGSAGDDRLEQLVRIARIRLALLDSIPMQPKIMDPDGILQKQWAPSDKRRIIAMPWLSAERECIRAWAGWAKAKIEKGEHHVPAPEQAWSGCAETFSTIEEIDAALSKRMEEFKEVFDQAARADQAACEVVDGYQNWGLPFALYLRSFETNDLYRVLPRDDEKTRWAQPAFDPPRRTWYCLSVPNANVLNDASILQFLREHTPVVFATNTFGGTVDEQVGPSLLLPDSEWQEPVRALIRHAELIAVRAVVASASILEELEMVRTLGKVGQTIVILPRERHARRMIECQKAAAAEDGVELLNRLVITADHSALSGMQVCYDDDLLAGKIECFRAPFMRILELMRMDPVSRFESYAERLDLS